MSDEHATRVLQRDEIRNSEEPMIWDRPNVLLSIDPEWAEAIVDGEKRWEYRKAPPKKVPPMRLVLYATAPVKAAIGVAYCGQIIEMEPDALADMTVDETPHDHSDIVDYFDGNQTGFALRVDGARRFEDGNRSIEELREMDYDPAQNFRYIGTAGIPEGWINV